MKIAVLIPDRGDRVVFTEQCMRMLKAQTRQADFIYHINENIIPSTDQVDITKRYRFGYEKISSNNSTFNNLVDLIIFWENDDYYHPTYIEKMLEAWDNAGRPDIFGTNYTIYYHLALRKYFRMEHFQRSSAMNTMIKPNLKIHWPVDHEPFTDQHIWMNEQAGIKSRNLWEPPFPLSLGIKHGVGKTGGKSHTNNLHRYTNDDSVMTRLLYWTDLNSYNFYREYSEHLKEIMTYG